MHNPFRAFCIFTVLFVFTNAEAQTDVPHIISYQGQVTSADGKAINGTHKLTVTFYSDWLEKTSVWQGKYTTDISNGIFTIVLGSGAYPLPEVSIMNRRLWVGIQVDDGTEMRPLTQLTGVPYAMNVADKSITMAKLADEVLFNINNSSGHTPTIQGVTQWLRAGNGTGDFTDGDLLGSLNSVTTDGHWDMVVKGDRIMEMRYGSTTDAGSLLGGWRLNTITSSVVGAIIVGGGKSSDINSIKSDYCFIGSGHGNTIGADFGGSTFFAWNSAIVAGSGNKVENQAQSAFIGGGSTNYVSGDYSTIGGGANNFAEDHYNVVAGGNGNKAGESRGSGDVSAFVGGGQGNWAREEYSTIVGGLNNTTGSGSTFIGGGEHNKIPHESDSASSWSAIVGGTNNEVNSDGGFIGGGTKNKIDGANIGTHVHQTSNFSVITAGDSNSILLNSDHSSIGGGYGNVINGSNSAIAGGRNLKIGANSFGFSGQSSSTVTDLSANSNIGIFNDVNVWIGNRDSVARTLRFYEPQFSSTYSGATFTSFRAGIQAANIEYLLPLTAGTNNQVLTTDASNNLSWTDKGTLVLKWYAESNVNPVIHAQATDTGAVSHGENVLAIGKYSSIGGGRNNLIDTGSAYAVIGGGKNNTIQTHVYSVLNGSHIDTFPPIVSYSVIAGGRFNFVGAPFNVISGGDSNFIGFDGFNSSYNVIGGGLLDTIDPGSPNNVICGGWKNHNGGGWSLMGSGARNYIYDNSICDLIGAGRDNFIGNQGRIPLGKGINFSSIVGGDTNKVSASWSAILGGKFNLIANDAEYSTLSGGFRNTIDTGAQYSTLSGGLFNIVQSPFGIIIGGDSNTIKLKSAYSVLSGGRFNLIDTSSQNSFIGSGLSDTVRSPYSVINGGSSNVIDKGITNSVIGGGFRNTSNSNAIHSTIGGGEFNKTRGIAGVIGGGSFNLIDKIDSASLASADWGTIGGGYRNTINAPPNNYCFEPMLSAPPIYGTIGGGAFNHVGGHLGTVIGGYMDSAFGMGSVTLGGWHLKASDWQVVAGRYNSLLGNSFDYLHNDTAYTGNTIYPDTNSAIFVIGNGTSDTTRSNAFTVSQNGHTRVYDVNKSGGATTGSTDHRPAYLGQTNSDNVILAWGDAQEDMAAGGVKVFSDFGVLQILRLAAGVYQVRLNVGEPGSVMTPILTQASITATIVDTTTDNTHGNCGMITTSPIGYPVPDSFIIKTYNGGSDCALYPKRFMFKVCGRK